LCGSGGSTRILFTIEITEITEEETLELLDWMRLASSGWIRYL
jgi:hypothetical protein